LQIFESPGKVVIGLERLILETVGFDFRTRYPQKLLVKVVRSILGSQQGGKAFFEVAYDMCIDTYKTFVPIKRTTFTMVMAVVELTARMTGGGQHLERVREFAARRRQYNRAAVMETMLDLLDLYVQHHRSTKIGARFDLNKFIDIKIHLNNDLDTSSHPRHLYHCNRCEVEGPRPLTPSSATSPATTGVWPADASIRRAARGQDGTMRFVFDPEAAQSEQDTVATYFREEFEEYEVEVEEEVPPPTPTYRDGGDGGGGGGSGGGGGGYGGFGGRGRGGYRGGYRDRGAHRRGGPYGGYRGDRSRGRRY
jgi:CTD kinase subunit beta